MNKYTIPVWVAVTLIAVMGVAAWSNGKKHGKEEAINELKK